MIITLLSGVFLGVFIQVLCWECEALLHLPPFTQRFTVPKQRSMFRSMPSDPPASRS